MDYFVDKRMNQKTDLNSLDREDQVILDALGPNLSKEFIELKQKEWVDYHRHVSDWEVERYLRFY